MIQVVLLLILVFGSTTPAFALPNQGFVVLPHEGIDHIGVFTFDPSPLPAQLNPFEVFTLGVNSFHLNFLGQLWEMPGNFEGYVHFTPTPGTLAPAFPVFWGQGLIQGFGRLSLLSGDFHWETGPTLGTLWQFEPWAPEYQPLAGLARTQLTPEPSTWVLFGSGLFGFAIWRRFQVTQG